MLGAFGPVLLLAACTTDAVGPTVALPTPIRPDEVDVFVGTGGVGFGTGSAYPGPALPFAMAHPGPDTQGELATLPALHCSGYRWEDPYVAAFSQIRMHGTGVPDYGAVSVMPVTEWSNEAHDSAAHRLPKGQEVGRPGYYSVELGADGPRVEVTSTLRAAAYRITFPADAPSPGVLVDLSYSMPDVHTAEAAISEAAPWSGSVRVSGPMSGRDSGWPFYVALRPGSVEQWNTSWTADEDGRAGIFFAYEPGSTVEFFVGLSFVDADGAWANLDAEVGTRDFDTLREEAESRWADELRRYAVGGVAVPLDGGDPAAERRIFASAIYHSLLMPTRYDDADGRVRSFLGDITEAPEGGFYSDLSLWDTYRTLHPLLDFIAPDHQKAILRSLVRMDEELGRLPRWPLVAGESGTMVGDPAAIVFAQSLLHGVGAELESPAALLQRLWNTADTRAETGLMERGWMATEEGGGSVSKTQEYSWADAAIAAVARQAGDTEATQRFEVDALRHAPLWDSDAGFYRGLSLDGTFRAGFDDVDVFDEDYVEGDAWHYLFMPMTDASGHAERMGGDAAAVGRLEEFFQLSLGQEDTLFPDPYYWHGNEPDIHAAWMFTLYGRPDLTRLWTHWIADTRYGLGAAGLDGNDDAGTLSAWYLWMAAGLYPIAGTGEFVLGLPRFPAVEIPAGDAVLRSVVLGCEPSGTAEIDHIEMNGERWDGPTIPVERLRGGVELRWICG